MADRPPLMHRDAQLDVEAQRLAARLIASIDDEQGQSDAIGEASVRVPDALRLGRVFGKALRVLTGEYVSALLARTDELEQGHPDTTREALVEEANAALERIQDLENAT
ncbi:hypothetical protein ACFUTX_06745 [Microbacterium sp. NPDC057407]|uniref:hypothetical protein n=1 Tax=Microbacterium sp. NPDC057407 TaxID=3346120 RepID=UPI00366D67B7